jgi:tetratricopeptide (TPR) repeat protein
MKAPLIAVSTLLFFVSLAAAQHADHKAPETAAAEKPISLVATDAISHRKVATSNKEAQAFFDQGLTLYYAFNDGDAVRSFRRAAELDPKLAMAHWGVALAAYPRGTGGGNPGDPRRMKEARDAIKTAMSLQAPPSDRIYIEALSKLLPDESGYNRRAAEDAYREAMKPIYQANPKDADAAALYALSIFYSAGYSNWTKDGEPVGRWPEMLAVIEAGLKLHPKHVGLTHTYIHGVEESLQPERALAAADTLRSQKIFIPSFGHLVHMPAHIYVRTGNFQKSVESNEETATMPTDTLSEEFKLWHYNHVLNFLLFSYAMQGNWKMVSNSLDRKFGYYTPRYSDQRPRYWVRFKRWDDILKAPTPPSDSRPETLRAWTWARAMALVATGDVARAEAERSEDRSDPNPLRKIDDARIDAAIARHKGEKAKEIDLLRDAVDAEDTLGYSEPPLSISPVRENLGGALLRDSQFVEAEKTFREDLRRNPGSGRSFFGLMTALEKQGKTNEAEKVRRQYLEAWKYADIKLTIEDL